MNCNDFNEWLQTELDSRSDLRLPSEHRQHYHQCDACRGQLDAWNQIACVLPNESSPRVQVAPAEHQGLPWLTGVSMLAIAGLLVLLIFGANLNPNSTITNQPIDTKSVAMVTSDVSTSPTKTNLDQPTKTPSNAAPAEAEIVSYIDASNFWQHVQERDWIQRTMPTVMPTVQSIQDGVAPIGRSFADAVRILTTGGRETPS